MNLTRESIRAIDAVADPFGVLSLYGDGQGVGRHRRSPADRALAMRRRLRRVEAGLREAGAAAVADRYRRWLPRIESSSTGSRTPRRPARRCSCRSARADRCASTCRCRWASTPALEPTGHVMPLVAAHDEGRPAGVVVARRSSVQVLEWRQGRIDEELELPCRQPGPRIRPSIAGSAAATGSTRSPRGCGGSVEQRGWRRMVIAGDPRLRAAVPAAARSATTSRCARWPASSRACPRDLAVSVAADLDAAQRQYEWRLVERCSTPRSTTSPRCSASTPSSRRSSWAWSSIW